MASSLYQNIKEYNIDHLDEKINKLQKQYEKHQHINTILNDQTRIDKEIVHYIQTNAKKIQEQLNNIKTLSLLIEKIVEENKTIQMQQQAYINFLESEEAIIVSNNLQHIKKIKEELTFFFAKEGIIYQSI